MHIAFNSSALRQMDPAAWVVLVLLATPPGIVTWIFGRLGVGINAQAAGFFLLILLHGLLRGRVYRAPWPPILTLITLVLAYAFMPRYFDAFYSGGKGRETVGLLINMTLVYILIFQILGGLKDRAGLVTLLESAILSASIGTSVILILQYAGALGGLEGDFSYAGFGFRVHSGIFCALGLFLAIKRYFLLPSWSIWRIAYVATICLMLSVVVMSTSRSAMAVAALACYFATLTRPGAGSSAGLGSVLRSTAALIILVSAISLYGPAAEKFFQADFFSGRLDIWENLLPRSVSEAIYGQGVGYIWSLSQYDISQWGGYISENNENIYAHNDFLFFLVELGALGVLMWLLFLWYHLKLALGDRRIGMNDSNLRSTRLSLAFVVIAVVIVESADTVIFGARNMFYVTALLALYSFQITSARRYPLREYGVYP